MCLTSLEPIGVSGNISTTNKKNIPKALELIFTQSTNDKKRQYKTHLLIEFYFPMDWVFVYLELVQKKTKPWETNQYVKLVSVSDKK